MFCDAFGNFVLCGLPLVAYLELSTQCSPLNTIMLSNPYVVVLFLVIHVLDALVEVMSYFTGNVTIVYDSVVR